MWKEYNVNKPIKKTDTGNLTCGYDYQRENIGYNKGLEDMNLWKK